MIPLRNFRRFAAKTVKQPYYAFQVGKKRMLAYFSYQFGRGRSAFPEAVTLFLTHRCNLRCKMCGQWGEGGVTKKQSGREELSVDDLTKIIDDLASFRPNITLFGGEPLLNPACVQIIRRIKEKGMHALMITNGSMLVDVADEIVSGGLDELNVSLDGDSARHDEIRGMTGVFDKIMGGIKGIQRAKTARSAKRPLINLQCTINRHNYLYLEELLTVAKEAGADSLTFHNLIFLTKEALCKQREFDDLLNCRSSDWEGFIFEPEIDVEVLYEKMKKIQSGRYDFSVDFFPNFSYPTLKEYYQNPSYSPAEYGARCFSPWMTAYIFPDGEVRPCLNFDYSYGNVNQNKFSQLWNDEAAIKFRRLVKKNGIFPVCVRCTELYRY